jgi:hypothetical protein
LVTVISLVCNDDVFLHEIVKLRAIDPAASGVYGARGVVDDGTTSS